MHNLKRDSILREADASLARLGVDAIDLYQIHWPIPVEDIEEGWAALAELKEQGLVRHIGVSNFDVEQLRRIQQIAPVETLQPPVLADRARRRARDPPVRRARADRGDRLLADGLRDADRRHDAASGSSACADDDWRKHDARFREPQLSRNLELVERLAAVAERHDTTPGAVAVAWTLRNPAVDGAIVGFRRPDQVDPILAAAEPRTDRRGPRRDRRRRTMSTAIGFIGLGAMGSRIAARLLDAGHQVYGTNRTAAKAQPLIERGLIWHDTPREVAAAADDRVQHGHRRRRARGDHRRARTGSSPDSGPEAVYVDMSTVSPHASRELAARVDSRGAQMLDAPVSGSIPQAETGTLAIMVGGDEHAFAAVEPLLRELGQTVTHIGANGQGLVLKLAINISLAVQTLAFSEGLAARRTRRRRPASSRPR